MSPALWLGLDPGDATDDERHVEHEVLDLLVAAGLEADLVCTHVVTGGGLTHIAATARLVGRAADPLEELILLKELLTRWSGAVVLDSEGDGTTVEAGPAHLRGGAREALLQVRGASAGRAVRFRGQEALVAPLAVLQVPVVSEIATLVPAVGALTSQAVLDPKGHVRPHFVEGRLVLTVRPGRDSTFVPVEKLETHACGGH